MNGLDTYLTRSADDDAPAERKEPPSELEAVHQSRKRLVWACRYAVRQLRNGNPGAASKLLREALAREDGQ